MEWLGASQLSDARTLSSLRPLDHGNERTPVLQVCALSRARTPAVLRLMNRDARTVLLGVSTVGMGSLEVAPMVDVLGVHSGPEL